MSFRAAVIRSVRRSALIAGWLLSHTVPRRKDYWVFSALGGDAFHGNSKYLYLYILQHVDDIEAVWVGDPSVVDSLEANGFAAYSEHSIRGIWAVLRGGVICNSHGTDVPWWATGGATLVQLWHGNGIKRFGWTAGQFDEMPFFLRVFYRVIYWNWSYAITTAPGDPRARLATAFSMSQEDILLTGYPRTDPLSSGFPRGSDINAPDLYASIESRSRSETLVTYCPTYRRAYGLELASASPTSSLDFETLNDMLTRQEAHLYIKLHPRESFDTNLDEYEHISLLPRDIDVMPLLAHTEILITDYSSVYLDYLLLDRPIIFFTPDRQEYLDHQSLYYDFANVSPGPVVDDTSSLHQVLGSTLDGLDEYAADRERVRRRFHTFRDGESSRRVIQALRMRIPLEASSSEFLHRPVKLAETIDT